jgi:hypothetical protein
MRLVQPPLVDLSWSSASLDARVCFRSSAAWLKRLSVLPVLLVIFLTGLASKLTAQSSEALRLDLGVSYSTSACREKTARGCS